LAETFETLWKRLLIYAPECPIPLAQEWINTAYSRALTRTNWAGLRAEAEFVIPSTYNTGTVTVTQNSAAVVGSGTTWTSSMIGRQFFTGGNGPFYTITDVPSSTSLTLDRTYAAETSAGSTYDIVLVYLPVPSDFLSFQSVMDRSNNWRLHTNFRQEQLDTWDSKRSVTGTPTLLAAAPFTSAGLARYELWPRVTTGKTYSYRYVKKPSLLSAASDTPIYPISGYCLIQGALSELSSWPGVRSAPNIFYDEKQHMMHEVAFERELQGLVLEDEKINQTIVTYEGWENVPFAPIDAAYLQTHDVY
jgi:hypothetical protein